MQVLKGRPLPPFSGTVFRCSRNHLVIHKVIQSLVTTCKVPRDGVARFRLSVKSVSIGGPYWCTVSTMAAGMV